jgi:hypothetical protein
MLGDPRYNRAPVASAPITSASVTSTHNASAPVASALLALAPVTSTHDAFAPVALALIASAPVTSTHNADTSTHDALAPMQCEDVDLVEAEVEMQDDNEEDAGFDVVENVILDVYQRQQQECEEKKLEINESHWCVKTKSGNAELVWTVAPDSIPENPPQEFSSIGVRNVKGSLH